MKMKTIKNVFIITFLILTFTSFSQEKTISVEKSIFGIQTGLLGAWVHNESRLSNSISLRSEMGLDIGVFGSDVNDNNGFILIPVIRLEPRWYYNLEKRNAKGKNIKNNSANFLTVNLSYSPDWFYISNKDNINIISSFAIVPKWGIKRSIGNYFTYETGIGIGYVAYLEDYLNKNGGVGLDLHLRIGYTF
jgi:hypothetical protein